jgi:hypothetical protein
MPALVDLDQYLADNNWRAAYEALLPEARAIAERVPLVHVSGNEHRLPFERLIFDPPHLIPTSAHATYCSDLTRRAEDLLSLPRSCYLYAGRAHPRYGSVALAFAAGCEAAREGSATPFDSGALVHHDPETRLQLTLEGGDSETNRAAFVQASQVPLNAWRDAFARFLAAYFHDSRCYWLDRPERLDPEDLFGLNDEWVAWTFEVRFDRGPSIHDRLAWCADTFVMSRLRQLEANDPLPTPGALLTPLQRFLQGPAPLAAAGSPEFDTELETWIRQFLGLAPL